MQSNQRITILTFNYPHDAIFTKSRLEAEGIDVYLKDENIIHANPLYSGAVGGVKLQVFEADYQLAKEILEAEAELPNIEEAQEPSKIWIKLNRITKKVPLVGHLKFEMRLIIITAIIVGLLATIFHFATKPSISEQVINKNWCVEKVVYNQKDYAPKSLNDNLITMSSANQCDEKVFMNKSGYIFLPGFNTISSRGEYFIFGDSLEVKASSLFDYVYDGYYALDLDGRFLTLRSKTTTIFCRKELNPNYFF